MTSDIVLAVERHQETCRCFSVLERERDFTRDVRGAHVSVRPTNATNRLRPKYQASFFGLATNMDGAAEPNLSTEKNLSSGLCMSCRTHMLYVIVPRSCSDPDAKKY